MKQVRLLQVRLNDFQGGTFALEAGGEDTDCYGANGTGKTRLASAFSWLLFDKDSLGRSDFSLKNLDEQGREEHGLDHSVECSLSVDGHMVTLKKVYHEIWAKKRGNAQALLTGNTTDHFINGVPVQKKDYVAQVAEIAGDETIFRLLTSPMAFPALHWTKQRALLLEVCGDLTDTQVIESDERLAPITDMLAQYKTSKKPFDDMKAVIASRRSEINKEIDKIPTRISEVKLGVPDVTGLNKNAVKDTIANLETRLTLAKDKLHGVDNGSDITELSKKLAGINADIQKIEQSYTADAMKTVNRLNQQITEITDAKNNSERRAKSISEAITENKKAIQRIEGTLEQLREKWTIIDSESFTDTTEEVCAACGQSLPFDRVEGAREKALAAFNMSKAERLAEVTDTGKRYAAMSDNLKKEIENLHQELIGLTTSKPEELEALISDRDTLKKMAEDYSSIAGRAELIAQRVATEAAIRDAKESVSFKKGSLDQDIEALEGQLKIAKDDADKFTRTEYGVKRIEELKAEENKLGEEFAKLEEQLVLLELFIKTKVSLLTDRINNKFEFARFKLFEAQVNGGINECCEITINGIPYNSGLNNAARINAGLDVCRTLAQHYGLVVPVFVDNAESVCELIDMDAQIVRLVVSEKDLRLRVEIAEKARVAA